jgi:flavorubredoxin
MIDTTEIARGIFRIALYDEKDMVDAGIFFPGATYNAFVIRADRPVLMQTLYRRTFGRVREAVARLVEPSGLQYLIAPHHEGDSTGALNEWLAASPRAELLCSEPCAFCNLRDLADRTPRVVADGERLDLGSHRLRFFMTPQVNQWDSLMVYEETTGTLFSNDLFSGMGTETIATEDRTAAALGAVEQLGYQPDDRRALLAALDKIVPLAPELVAPMHGPAIRTHVAKLFDGFRTHAAR